MTTEDDPSTPRPWYQKKRFAIPGGLLALSIIGSVVSPPEAEEANALTPAEETTPTEAAEASVETTPSTTTEAPVEPTTTTTEAPVETTTTTTATFGHLCQGIEIEVDEGEDPDAACSDLSLSLFQAGVAINQPDLAARIDAFGIWPESVDFANAVCTDLEGTTMTEVGDENIGLMMLLLWNELGSAQDTIFDGDATLFAEFVGMGVGSYCPERI